MAAETFSLDFSKRFYTAAALKKAVRQFGEDGELKLEKTATGHTLTGHAHDPELAQTLQDELYNAALYHTLEAKRQW